MPYKQCLCCFHKLCILILICKIVILLKLENIYGVPQIFNPTKEGKFGATYCLIFYCFLTCSKWLYIFFIFVTGMVGYFLMIRIVSKDYACQIWHSDIKTEAICLMKEWQNVINLHFLGLITGRAYWLSFFILYWDFVWGNWHVFKFLMSLTQNRLGMNWCAHLRSIVSPKVSLLMECGILKIN